MILTQAEREFYDVWFREDCGYPAVYATPLIHSRGITYDHLMRMYAFYIETWKSIGEWPDGFPPMPENPEPPCPWPTREALEARLEELETGPFSHLTHKPTREWMLKKSASEIPGVSHAPHAQL
jgi:hypothetical protein